MSVRMAAVPASSTWLCRPCEWVSGEAKQGCDYLRRLSDVFGCKFVIWLVSCYMGIKGAMGRFVSLGQLPYFLCMGVTAADYQIYGSVALTPWALKALWGPLSDSVSLCGYNKRYWIVVMSLLGVGAFGALASIDFQLEQAPIAAVLFFTANADASMVDILGQGKYAEMMVQHPDTSSDLVTWVWMNFHVGALAAATLVGPLADLYNPRVIFWICVPLAAQIIPFSLWPGASEPRGFLPEQKKLDTSGCSKVCHLDTEKLVEQPKLFTMAATMAVAAIGMAAVNLLGTQMMQLVYALGAASVLCTLGFFCMGRTLAKANLYMFLAQALYVSAEGALDFFYLAEADCVPNGPAFSFSYYVTWTNVVGSVFSILGVALFQVRDHPVNSGCLPLDYSDKPGATCRI
jgi:hypothetical protein